MLLRIFSGLCALFFLVILIRSLVSWDKRYKAIYEKNGKKEYFEYGEYIRKNVYKSVLYAIAVFICCIITFGQV